MALGNINWYTDNTNGVANAGAGFVKGGSGTNKAATDAEETRTDIVIDGATDTDITSAANAFDSTDVGNVINITAGTGFTTGYYEIVSESGGVATLDRAVGTVASTGGSGSVGGVLPTVQAAMDEASGGDDVWVGDTSAYTLASTLNWTAFGGGTSLALPIIFRAWDYSAGAGVRAPSRAEIDGNNAVANIFSPTSDPAFQIYIDLKMHNTTGNVVDGPNDLAVMFCEVFNGGSDGTLKGGARFVAIGNNVHTGTSGAIAITGAADARYLFNRITAHDDAGIGLNGQRCVLIGNLIHDVTEDGISTNAADYTLIYANTVVGDNSAGDDGFVGQSTTEWLVILSNIFKDFGASGTGGGMDLASGENLLIGYNTLHGNDDDTIRNDSTVGLDLGNNQTTDPQFVNAGSDDYDVGANAKADGYPVAFLGAPNTTPSVDVGASQRVEPAGGGGLLVHPGMEGGYNG